MTARARAALTALLVAAICCAGASTRAVSQGAPVKASANKKEDGTNLPNAFQGFSRNRKDPVKIEANTLEVHDRDKYAIFIGNVFVQQGESTMRCRQLKVFYENTVISGKKGKTPSPAQTAEPAPTGKATPAGQTVQNNPEQRIRRLEAMGGVIIASKDQKATGDFGVFDMQTNTATITGNVVVTQGPNLLRGEKLVVDLNTGWSHMEASGKAGPGRVQGLFVPNSAKDGKTAQPKK